MTQHSLPEESTAQHLSFYGGMFGAILPFVVFLLGVVFIALSGAPDERGFWPILILALGLGLMLAKDKTSFSETVIDGMSQRIVMIMIMAWMLASIIGVLMRITGFVDALIWLANLLSLGGTGFVIATCIICCLVSLSTGSSFATILICGPILYPAGGLLGAHLPTLAGAILGGATFGDFIAPISDTMIASTLSQKAEIGPTVRSRVKYILPVILLALVAFGISNVLSAQPQIEMTSTMEGSPGGIPMFLVPVLIVFLFLRGKHLVHGLLFGLLFGIVLALMLGLLPLDQLLSIDHEKMSAQSFVIDGINRAVGISFFTILLMGLVACLKASGLISRLVEFASRHSTSVLQAEAWIAGTVGGAVLLTTHSIVAMLMVADFSNTTGKRMGIQPTRRSNLLSLVVCVFPFLLPYFIPVILMANTTSSGAEFGIASVPPLETGLYNFVSWGLLAMLLVSLFLGYGRAKDQSV